MGDPLSVVRQLYRRVLGRFHLPIPGQHFWSKVGYGTHATTEDAPVRTPSKQLCIPVPYIRLRPVKCGIVDVEGRISFFILQADVYLGTLQQEATSNKVSISQGSADRKTYAAGILA